MQLPVFLENTPGVICDQILFLVKNSNLEFQINETPFSLNISVKKRFSNHWNWNQLPSSSYSQPPPQHPHHNLPQQSNANSDWNLPHEVQQEGPLNPHRKAHVPSHTHTPPGTPP